MDASIVAGYSGWPADADSRARRCSQADMDAPIRGGEVRTSRRAEPGEPSSSGGGSNESADSVAIAVCAPQLQLQPVSGVWHNIVKQQRFALRIDNQRIHSTVVVVVANRQSTPHDRPFRTTS